MRPGVGGGAGVTGHPADLSRADPIQLSPVSDDPNRPPRAAARRAGDRRAGRAVREGGPESPWSAARCATRCWAGCTTDLDFATSAHPDEIEQLLQGWADAIWDMGRDFGTIGGRKGDWTVEITTYRADTYDPDVAQARRWRSATPSSATWAGATSRSTRWRCALPGARVRRPVRRAGRPRAAGAANPGHAGGVVLRRPAADDACRPVRRAAGLRRRARGRRGDDRHGGAARDHLGRADPRRAGQAGLLRPHPRRGLACWSTPGWPTHVLPELPALRARARRAPPAQGRLRAHAHRARAGDRDGDRLPAAGPGPRRSGWPRSCTTSASRAPAGSRTTARSRSTTTTWWARS